MQYFEEACTVDHRWLGETHNRVSWKLKLVVCFGLIGYYSH